jgi:hypothetical protein
VGVKEQSWDVGKTCVADLGQPNKNQKSNGTREVIELGKGELG